MPPFLDRGLYDKARGISADEARPMCRRLAREEELLVGTSTGLNVTAAVGLAEDLGPGKTVVTVGCDTGLKYMNGNLFSNEWDRTWLGLIVEHAFTALPKVPLGCRYPTDRIISEECMS